MTPLIVILAIFILLCFVLLVADRDAKAESHKYRWVRLEDGSRMMVPIEHHEDIPHQH